MNIFAKSDVQARVDYYGIGGVPWTVLDGDTSHATWLSHSYLFGKQGYTAPIKVGVSTTPIGTGNVLSGNVVITAGQALTGSYVLRIIAIERAIIMATPSPNGTTQFYDILRKLLPASAGQTVTISSGASTPYAFTWTFDTTKVKKSQLEVVAYVQNATTHAIVNAGTSFPTYFVNGQIGEQTSSVRNSYTHYIQCWIKNDNATSVNTKITIRDSTKSTFTNTKLEFASSAMAKSLADSQLVDSIVTTIPAGDSLVFWAVTTTPATTGTKAVLEVFALNRSDPQALGWGAVRYLNLTTSATGTQYPKPVITGVVHNGVGASLPQTIEVKGDCVRYAVPRTGKTSISLLALNGAVVARLKNAVQEQGIYTLDLRSVKMPAGSYIVNYSFDGITSSRIVMFDR